MSSFYYLGEDFNPVKVEELARMRGWDAPRAIEYLKEAGNLFDTQEAAEYASRSIRTILTTPIVYAAPAEGQEPMISLPGAGCVTVKLVEWFFSSLMQKVRHYADVCAIGDELRPMGMNLDSESVAHFIVRREAEQQWQSLKQAVALQIVSLAETFVGCLPNYSRQ